MNRSIALITWIGLCLCSLMANADDAAGALLRQVYERPQGRDSAVRAVMTLREGGSVRTRDFVILRIRPAPGNSKTLIRFSSPPDVADTALLTYDRRGSDSSQWLYLPALKKERRISASRKGGRFVGSDFFFQDMQERDPGRDQHLSKGQAEVGGVPCEVVESTPLSRDDSAYSKWVSWIHPQTLVPLQVEFYEKGRDMPSKRLKARKLKKTQGYWTVFESTMYDLNSSHETEIRIDAIKYDQGIPDQLFSQQALSDTELAAGYLP